MSAERQTKEEAKVLVVGLGASGLAAARHLARRGIPFAVADSRLEPPGVTALRALVPHVELHLGPFDAGLFRRARRLVLSPGVAPQEPAVAAAAEAGVEVLGEVELFAREVEGPVVGVTGSNGKSTVTTLLGEMAVAAGRRVAMGGNLGTPALELLDRQADLYVLELSSFQLETTVSLRPEVALLLNLSADHLDRHGSLEAYTAAKARILRGARRMVLNADDPRVRALGGEVEGEVVWFTLGPPAEGEWGLREGWLCHGDRRVVEADALRIPGRHNQANALAALAAGTLLGLDPSAMVDALVRFPGLPHRTQWVAERDGVAWYDDSKATNVGATLAAVQGMPGPLVLIMGGEGKGADFAPLRDPVARKARAVVLIGRDAPLIESALGGAVPVERAGDMRDAVARAARLARTGDQVLLSPACASWDMFNGFAERGEAFASAVREAAA